MSSYRYSRKAKEDLRRIATYTKETWGEEQARVYLSDLERVCQRVALLPMSGSEAPERAGYRKVPCEGSTIYYRLYEGGQIEIVRILHARMLAERHL